MKPEFNEMHPILATLFWKYPSMDTEPMRSDIIKHFKAMYIAGWDDYNKSIQEFVFNSATDPWLSIIQK